MGMRISTNVASVNAQRSMSGAQRDIQKSFAQLSSGNRITKAADDAAGLSISEGLKANSRSIQQAIRNSNDGISMVQVAEGGLNEISNIMTRLRELGIQAASDTVGEKEDILKYNSDMFTQSPQFVFTDFCTIDENLALIDFVESGYQVDD